MFFSKFYLDIKNPSVKQCLRNCQDMHRSIMRMFNDTGTREQLGILYRIFDQSNRLALYMISQKKPDYLLIQEYGFLLDNCRDISNLSDKLLNGMVLSFDTVVCPCKKVWDGSSKNSKRVMLRTGKEREEWLNERAAKNGFNIEWLREEDEVKVQGAHKPDQGGQMNHRGIHFKGVLKIMDKDAFYKAYTTGIGPEKAYGFGMLLVAPVRS